MSVGAGVGSEADALGSADWLGSADVRACEGDRLGDEVGDGLEQATASTTNAATEAAIGRARRGRRSDMGPHSLPAGMG
jgi:hypothetical protein